MGSNALPLGEDDNSLAGVATCTADMVTEVSGWGGGMAQKQGLSSAAVAVVARENENENVGR